MSEGVSLVSAIEDKYAIDFGEHDDFLIFGLPKCDEKGLFALFYDNFMYIDIVLVFQSQILLSCQERFAFKGQTSVMQATNRVCKSCVKMFVKPTSIKTH